MSQYREQAIKLVLEMRNKHGYAGSNHALAECVLELEAENERLRDAVNAKEELLPFRIPTAEDITRLKAAWKHYNGYWYSSVAVDSLLDAFDKMTTPESPKVGE